MRSIVYILFCIVFIGACGGKVPVSKSPGFFNKTATIDDLIQDFDQYEVSFFREVGPTAIYFDQKADDFNLQLKGKYWSIVETAQELQDLVKIMQDGYGLTKQVRAIAVPTGEESFEFGGYVYTPAVPRYSMDEENPNLIIAKYVFKSDACLFENRARVRGGGLCYTEREGAESRSTIILKN